MNIFEGLFYIFAMTLYAFTFSLSLIETIFKRELKVKSNSLFIIGSVFHFLAFLVRYIVLRHIPTIGTYENILTGSLFIVLFCLIFLLKLENKIALFSTIGVVLLLMGIGIVSDTTDKPFVASLKSFWLYIHIFFAWLSYGAFTTGFGLAISYLIKEKGGKNLGNLVELMFKLTAFGLITDAVMIAAGSIWAKNLWGSYWSWDPVETWSLISFLLYGLILHLRITLKISGKLFAYLLIFALITVLISFWGVNFIMTNTLHIFTVD